MILCDSGVRPGCRWQPHRKNRANGAEAMGGGVFPGEPPPTHPRKFSQNKKGDPVRI